jgi:hypothetical protein
MGCWGAVATIVGDQRRSQGDDGPAGAKGTSDGDADLNQSRRGWTLGQAGVARVGRSLRNKLDIQ